MERATLLQQQLGITGRPSRSVREEPTLVREEPTLVREEPTLVREEPTLVREEPTLVREEPTLESSTEYLNEADIGPDESAMEQSAPAPPAPPRTMDIDIPDFRRHQIGPATVIAAMGAAVALLVASVASHPFGSRAELSVETGIQRVATKPMLQQLPELRSPASASSPLTPVITRAPPQQTPVATSLENGSSAVAVTIKVVPADAVIFRAGQKLGTGGVQVSVDRNAKQRLTALHDGYAPYNFTVDGSRDTVTVRLKRATRP
jgi:hypothetical protein